MPEEKADEIDERRERPALVQEARERREARELPVRPAEKLQQFLQRAVGAEDLREERAREDEHDREVNAAEAADAAQGDEGEEAADEAAHAAAAYPIGRKVRLEHEGARDELEPERHAQQHQGEPQRTDGTLHERRKEEREPADAEPDRDPFEQADVVAPGDVLGDVPGAEEG